ncbi:MAG TPA: stage II sporulation protein P [Candidatus Scatomonas pullistercoris]|uniref:Stage II sporulation protein P n=1 Tax=Candidatus Scatomonas pullistercoris TaxID=2840920 RepID=A0A9D1P405_9FIRM|nr:stage II sporulation protein P [Candidatus Scatomonas pullistercoris]
MAASACLQAGEAALSLYLPQSVYEEEQSGWLQELAGWAREQLPFFTFFAGTEEKNVVEDDTTIQAMIEENEKRIAERIQEENSRKAEEESRQPEDVPETETPAEQETAASPELQPVAEIPVENLQNYEYLLNEFFVVDPNTVTDAAQLNAGTFLEKDLTLERDSAQPQILIYHTHSQEGFADSVEGDVNTTVIGVGEHLAQILRDQYGYQVIHNMDSFDLVDGVLDRSKAYDYALPVIQQILEENPSIQVVIDLHRDGVNEDTRLVTDVNGVPTAKVMFFNGLSKTAEDGELGYLPNPYIEDNLAFSFQMEYEAKQYFPDFTRCIYLKGYRYNLHLRPRSVLLEVGAQTNTVEEAMNAMDPFAYILNKVLQGS